MYKSFICYLSYLFVTAVGQPSVQLRRRSFASKRVTIFVWRMLHTVPLLSPDAYLERLRKEVALAKEGNRKVSDEIGVIAETTANGCFFISHIFRLELLRFVTRLLVCWLLSLYSTLSLVFRYDSAGCWYWSSGVFVIGAWIKGCSLALLFLFHSFIIIDINVVVKYRRNLIRNYFTLLA